MEDHKEIVNQIYNLRQNFVIIGLTGKTGSGCSTIAELLRKDKTEIFKYKSLFKENNDNVLDNDYRKNKIVHQFIKENWKPFTVISASNIILFYALLMDYDDFIHHLCYDGLGSTQKAKGIDDKQKKELKEQLGKEFENRYNNFSNCAREINNKLGDSTANQEDANAILNFVLKNIPCFRIELQDRLQNTYKKSLGNELQVWGNNIRCFNKIHITPDDVLDTKAPSCLAHKINQIIKLKRKVDKKEKKPTLVVIDALRNPYEILYFHERYAAYYTWAINTEDDIRRNKLLNNGIPKDIVDKIDSDESTKHEFWDSYQKIDIIKCIELSDVFVTHDGTPIEENRALINQIHTYISLIFHPGLIPPSPLERIMQVAYTAKLNSGCLSRQVGAAVTNSSYSLMSIGWNTVAEGQTPCTLRCLNDLCNGEDSDAYSSFERHNETFKQHTKFLITQYGNGKTQNLNGLNLAYCFKDIHTSTAEKQKFNQVHTRSLHAEENAFLQLVKYGTTGVKGGKLFTTASCCELCAKKAYQLGITEIYYIDSYPGITKEHILECGTIRPKTILFHGVIGRAFINLYNPFLPMKDEIHALTGISMKKDNSIKENKTEKQNGDKDKNNAN